MLRRQFMKGILSGIVSLALLASKRGRAEHIPLFTCMTAGFQFYEGPLIIKRLAPGDRLIICREQANSHDLRAVALYTPDRRKLGYIPRHLNEIPAAHLDNGEKLFALVHTTASHLPPWEMLEVAVLMEMKKGG